MEIRDIVSEWRWTESERSGGAQSDQYGMLSSDLFSAWYALEKVSSD